MFTTAFDQYAVQAFKVNAIDYLLKPIDPDDLSRALDKIQKQQKAPEINLDLIAQYFKKENYKDRFLVKTGQQLAFLQVQDIAYSGLRKDLRRHLPFPVKSISSITPSKN